MYERIKTSEIFPDNLLAAIGITDITPELQEKILALLPNAKYRAAGSEQLLRMYFEENLTMKVIGSKVNLSTERVRQKINLAIYDLKRQIRIK